jgi:drug/metabolite transporter (DMT)-like permease
MELTPAQRTSRSLTLFGFIAMVLIWGSFPVVVKIGIANVPPLLFSSIRFCIAFCIMVTICLVQRKNLRITLKEHLQISLVSLCMVGIPSSIFFVSALYAPVSVLTLMWATAPIFTALFNMSGEGEIRGWRLPASLAIGSLGILIVLLGRLPFWPGDNSGTFTFASSGLAFTGEVAVLASAAVYGLGMSFAKRSSPNMPVTVLTAWQVFYSSLFIALMSFIFERGHVVNPTWVTLGALFYLAIFCGCISFFLTFWLIRRIGTIRTAYGDFLIPGVTLVLSFLILGEDLSPAKIGGLVLVILGVIFVET